MDEALLKSGVWPNVAVEAGADPRAVMREHGVNDMALRVAVHDMGERERALEGLVRELWRELAYATNAKVVRCKACGRTIVSMGARGVPRQFCDGACQRWANRNPGREYEHKRKNGDVEPDNFMFKLYERIAEEGVDV